ncbi:MAG: biotin--[acetyl-CoA-carboxylase] ligase [bacterium]
MTSPSTASSAAEIVRALGVAGGTLPLREATLGLEGPDLDAALAALEASGVLALGPDGLLRFGPRGSALSAADVTRRLATRELGRPLEVLAACESTNDVAQARATAGAAAGLVVCAELQTRGRGRRGRSFDSPPGLGLWTSVLLPSPADPSTAPRLSLVAGLAACAAIEDVADVSAALKWPNDVRVGGRKVCGVLVEARSVGRRLFPVAGIGVNVHHRTEDFPAELRETAVSVQEAAGARVERGVLLATLLARLELLLDEERGGTLDLAAAFAPRDEMRGREVVVETGGAALRGMGRGVAADGALLIEVPGRGVVPVRAGETTLRAVA